jgi:hypothetical protein
MVVLQNSVLEHTFYEHSLKKLSAKVSELSSEYETIGPTMLVEWLDDKED